MTLFYIFSLPLNIENHTILFYEKTLVNYDFGIGSGLRLFSTGPV